MSLQPISHEYEIFKLIMTGMVTRDEPLKPSFDIAMYEPLNPYLVCHVLAMRRKVALFVKNPRDKKWKPIKKWIKQVVEYNRRKKLNISGKREELIYRIKKLFNKVPAVYIPFIMYKLDTKLPVFNLEDDITFDISLIDEGLLNILPDEKEDRTFEIIDFFKQYSKKIILKSRLTIKFDDLPWEQHYVTGVNRKIGVWYYYEILGDI